MKFLDKRCGVSVKTSHVCVSCGGLKKSVRLLTVLKCNIEAASMKGVNEMFNALLSNDHYRLSLFFSNEPLLAFISCPQSAL